MNFDDLDKKMRIYEHNYDNLPSWQKRGIGLWKEDFDKEGLNPITGERTMAKRSRIHVEYELPLGNDYGTMIRQYV